METVGRGDGLNLRLKDLLGPVTRVKKKKKMKGDGVPACWRRGAC